jgi:SAM-dependent methyltransferase
MYTPKEAFCPICGQPSRYYSRKRGWRIYHCISCDHFHVFPAPTRDDLARIYSSAVGYGLGRIGDLSQTSSKSAVKLDAVLSPLVGDHRRLLDVGCGDGRLLYHMRNLGWGVAGTEFSDAYVGVARSHGLEIFHGNLDDARFNEGSFSAVTLGDVIEHLVCPRQVLASIRKLLVKNGVVVIRTPNAGCGYSRVSGTVARITRTQWLASEAPMHVNDFTETSLSLLVSECGFRVLSCHSNGRRNFAYTVGASGYLDGVKQYAKSATGVARSFRMLSSAALIAPVALWTLCPFLVGRLWDRMDARGDYLSLLAQVI